MNHACIGFLTVLTLSAAPWAARAQSAVTVFGEHPERGGTRVAYWDNAKNQAIGEVAIQFGRPAWKEEYGPKLDEMTSGKVWRLGENFWSSLDTNLPLSIAGRQVPVGHYYLVVTRPKDGSTWNLAFVDPAKARKRHLDAYEVLTRPSEVPILFETELVFAEATETVAKMDIELVTADGKDTEGTLTIRWGSFELKAPFEVTLPS